MADTSPAKTGKKINAQETTYGENRVPESSKRPAPENEKPDAQSIMTGDTSHKHTR